MSKIKVMDEILANKIAAGEVVERCASVVKELVENSIDAKSSEIKIDLIEAGTKEIKVVDNGIGMDRIDAKLSFERHATSKIKDEDDLYHIDTLGFRGEALASIASVSKVELKTSTGGVGTFISISGGKIDYIGDSDARIGTEITIKDLFYNTPARLKHMKSLYTELSSIVDFVNKIALAHPDIKFILSNNSNILLNTDGNNNLLKTISNIYGIDTVKKMVEISGSDNDYVVNGFITLPEVHRSNRNNMITLVNGRVVKNTELNRTINDAYSSYKPDNRYPIVVIDIEVDPSLIDVNIHPTKMDIKFSKMEELNVLISNLIKSKLDNKTLIPKVEVRVEPKNYEEIKLDFSKIYEDTIEYNKSDISISSENEVDEKQTIVEEITEETEIIEEEIEKNRLPELYPVGLVHGTYIICQNDLGMYLIDQHAAKERINYEKYRDNLCNPKKSSNYMLIPITLELTTNELLILKHNMNALENMGFIIEEFGMSSIIIKAHPSWLLKGYEEESIKKIIDFVIEYENKFSLDKFNDLLSATLACKMSIKANTSITLLEMENLILDLRECENPFNCPHGRPTIIYYSKYDLEKLFKRSGF